MCMEFYRKIIQDELVEKATKNPLFSQRAFAKALSIDPGTLSRILQGKRMPGKKLIAKLLENLSLSPDDQRKFLFSVQQTFSGQQSMEDNSHHDRQGISEELFRVISDWYFFAILELTYVAGFECKAKWIAKNLQISEVLAQSAIDKLLDLGFLERIGGRVVKSKKNLTTENKALSSSAHRKRQVQVLEKAKQAIDEVPLEKRSQTGMTMAVNSKKIPAAKQMILDFNRNLSVFLEDGTADTVYELSISLFPLQQPKQRTIR
jgi:uncharacterized protein (TIGR02147 family)